MSTIADLPASARMLTNREYGWSGTQDQSTREENFAWYCPYGDGDAFYAALVGTVQTISYGNYSITRAIPLRHPFNPRLWATKVTWEGVNGPGTTPSAPFAFTIFKVTFGYLPYNSSGDEQGTGADTGSPPFCRITAQASTRSVTDTGRQYTYSLGGNSQVKLKHDVAVQYSGNSFDVTLYALPDIDAWQAVVAPLNGKVNSQPFQLGAFTRGPGTVLFDGYAFDIDQDILGNARWTGSVKLQCSTLPWNSYPVGSQVVTLSPPPYQSADLNVLYM